MIYSLFEKNNVMKFANDVIKMHIIRSIHRFFISLLIKFFKNYKQQELLSTKLTS